MITQYVVYKGNYNISGTMNIKNVLSTLHYTHIKYTPVTTIHEFYSLDESCGGRTNATTARTNSNPNLTTAARSGLIILATVKITQLYALRVGKKV